MGLYLLDPLIVHNDAFLFLETLLEIGSTIHIIELLWDKGRGSVDPNILHRLFFIVWKTLNVISGFAIGNVF